MSTTDHSTTTRPSLLNRLYTGTGAIDVVGKRRLWFGVTGLILLVCVLSMIFRGFTLSIDFEGGTQVSFPASAQTTVSAVESTYRDALGGDPQSVQTAGSGAAKTVQIRTETLDQQQLQKLTGALAGRFGPAVTTDNVSNSDVSSTWGDEITKKALIALVVFLAIVLVYIAIRFDREMSVAAIAALIFDVVTTAGIYSLVGFEVSPATVIGLLTILGFSLYDTVVVFDKVGENTRAVLRTTRRTYGEQANLAVNQTLMRSINTTVISVLPILALIVVAVWLLGVGTLKDLALIQLVGVVSGTFSSIFFATPLLVTLKNMRSDVRRHTAKVLARRAYPNDAGDSPVTASDGDVAASQAPLMTRTSYAPQPTRPPTNRPVGKRRRR